MNFSDEEKQAFEDELQNTDATAILLGIHSELAQIRMLLEQTDSDTSESVLYVCDMCGETISKENLQAHAKNEHNAPTDMELNQLGHRANR